MIFKMENDQACPIACSEERIIDIFVWLLTAAGDQGINVDN